MLRRIGITFADIEVVHPEDDSEDYFEGRGVMTLVQEARVVSDPNNTRIWPVYVPAQSIKIEGYFELKSLYEDLKYFFEQEKEDI